MSAHARKVIYYLSTCVAAVAMSGKRQTSDPYITGLRSRAIKDMYIMCYWLIAQISLIYRGY